jgi:hypothetical protein
MVGAKIKPNYPVQGLLAVIKLDKKKDLTGLSPPKIPHPKNDQIQLRDRLV